MNIKEKTIVILLNLIPIILMIAIIPVIKNDYFLTGIYISIIVISLVIKYSKRDYLFFLFGFIVMTVSECFFISTGVETFERNSLFGLMPLWLPVLWAYSFIAMRRAVIVIDK